MTNLHGDTTVDPQPPNTRRLHLSTWLIVLPAAAALALVMVPGEYVGLGSTYRRGLPPPYTTWLNYGSHVVTIRFGRTILSPDDANFDIDVLAPLDEVAQLDLGDPITDDDLTRLPRLPELEYLSLSMFEPISDRGLSCLDRMPNLKVLQVGAGNFTAKGFSYVGSRHQLALVLLAHCEFSEDALVHLANLPGLTQILFSDCTITDEAVPQLARLHGLKKL
jgi:hypothetical protein